METLKAKLIGVAPLMMHSERLADPTHPGTREMKKLTKQKNKTDDLLEQIKKIEWRLGFYEAEGRPIIPADNLLATMTNGAKKSRKGNEAKAGVFCQEPHFFLDYKGPKDIESLYLPEFIDYRSVVVAQKRTMRCRPIFREWSAKVELLFDEELMARDELKQALTLAGERVGLMERRPRLGRFEVEFLKN